MVNQSMICLEAKVDSLAIISKESFGIVKSHKPLGRYYTLSVISSLSFQPFMRRVQSLEAASILQFISKDDSPLSDGETLIKRFQ